MEGPIVGGLPDAPGILTALRLTPELGIHLRGLADELLVNDFPGATIVRAEREMLATAVSAANDCFFCMDSHAAHATALLEVTGRTDLEPLLDTLKLGSSEGFDDKMRALLHIARVVRREPRQLTAADVADGPCRGCVRCRRPARRPDFGSVLDVQPDGRRVPGRNRTGPRDLPRARRRHREARV